MFRPVESKWDPPALETRVLEWWGEQNTFKKLLEKNKNGQPWSFIDGPITANGPMGVHHAWGRTYKDIYQRYKAMRGFKQRYQNGFDCQGLWVEVEVEKSLGFNSKRDIESYGLAEFARACRARVDKYSVIQTQQSQRLGQWMDWENSYYTHTDTNIVYNWHFLKKCQENGWLYRGTRSMPWCIRCGTSLSQHELLDSYREMTHSSVFVRQPLTSPGHEGEYLLMWTTTPWTLAANVAAAVHPKLDYVKVRQGDYVYYLSKGATGRLRGEYELLDTVKGADLIGLEYTGPWDELQAQQDVKHRVISWEDVGDEEGVGIVHIAPGCGAEDFELGKVNDLPVLIPIDEAGNYVKGYGPLVGHNAHEVAPEVFANLEEKGYVYYVEPYTHRYPVCWRCGTDLVFRVVTEWFIKADEIRPRMKAAAAAVKWTPDEAGKRMQDWLNNMRDWCISRKRFWGLVLPFYVCNDCDHVTVVGSKAELRERAIEPGLVDELPELHRPWMDDIVIRCEACGQETKRVTEVGDAWLDAGIVPFSTTGYLGDGPGREYWETWYPANWITEMREQIRLWFYSMLFMSVTLEDRAPYERVMVYEKVHDETDRPMHKSWGNSIEFNVAAERMGADVMRWLYAGQNLKNNVRFGFGIAEEIVRRILTLWNTYNFFITYANLDKFDPSTTPKVPYDKRGELDRWILSRLHLLVRESGKDMDQFDVASVTRGVESFVEDLSNWYLRRSRRRFWKSESDEDKAAAYWTLYEALTTVNRLIAPIMPFLAEELYQNLVASVDKSAPESVHLTDYPVADESLIDEELIADTTLVQQVVELGRAARARNKLKVRQPLREMQIYARTPEEAAALRRHEDQVLEELNIKALSFVDNPGELVSYVIKPNLPVLGPRLGKRLRLLNAALQNGTLNPVQVADAVRAGNPVQVQLEGEDGPLDLGSDDLIVESKQKEGFAVEQDKGLIVALDTTLTEDLRREGLARDLVRLVQEMRKSAGFEISDRISTSYSVANDGEGAERVRGALSSFGDYIKQETLSTELTDSPAPAGSYSESHKLEGVDLQLAVQR